jgi:hypothetical protein
MRQRKRLFSAALFALIAQAGVARAQTTQAPPAHEDRDQHVLFDDDLLNADLTTPFGDPVFSKHMPPARVLLIRLRMSFVPELYESVEQI